MMIQTLPQGSASPKLSREVLDRLYQPLKDLQAGGDLSVVSQILDILTPLQDAVGDELLLNSPAAWDLLIRMADTYDSDMPFLDFFWTWRMSLASFYSMLLHPLPEARVYHAVSTGYAGLLAARASLETHRPILLTEHGIYTTERRIEIAMADWLYEAPSEDIKIEGSGQTLRDIWVKTFITYSRACYQACSKIITLYEGNQQLQIEEGADPEKAEVIPNGVDYAYYVNIASERDKYPPTIAFIGRVVPIKDVKTFIRACGMVLPHVSNLRVLVLGPTDEDEDYFQECQNLVSFLNMDDHLEFTGKVQLGAYLGQVHVIALTSISEAQPLVILEAGAAGVPSVATNVGACKEMILGRTNEDPPLGAGGAITPLANPGATAAELTKLLVDDAWREQCGRAIKERVRRYYQKTDLDRTYRALYDHYRHAPDTPPFPVSTA